MIATVATPTYLAERRNVLVVSWILARELVRREAEHDQPLIRVLLVQLFQPRELESGWCSLDQHGHLT